MALFSFSKKERLKNKIEIESLFSEGNRFFEYPFNVIWKLDSNSDSTLKMAVSVPKKKIPNATDRNKIKRLVREAFRKNKTIIQQPLEAKNVKLHLMLVYSQSSIISMSEIEDKISVTLQRLAEQI
ncbi:ribonuclease P protein component [Flavobacteriales bacterium]|jgi:ribonuclease P protein component|nr:ribonuclease P protein component [Flavobacteriales bacterium]MDB2361831.1 ribonuclease P protein component [Flavobacteriales bacterium]